MKRAAGKLVCMILVGICVLAGCGGEEDVAVPSPGSDTGEEEELYVFMASGPSEYMDEVRQDMNHLVIPLFVYHGTTSGWPTTDQGLRALIERPEDLDVTGKWHGPYIPTDLPDADQLFIDPWGNAYVYRETPGEEKPFDLRSLGPDGVESEDDIPYTEFGVSGLIQ